MKLLPVPESLIDNLERLIKEARIEMHMPQQATLDRAMETLRRGYAARTLAAYVDSVIHPKHCVILSHTPGLLLDGVVVGVMFIYSVPEERGRDEVLDAMHLTIDTYAAIHGAVAIMGSSWKFKGSRNIDAMWLSRGYEVQETTFVKLLETQ